MRATGFVILLAVLLPLTGCNQTRESSVASAHPNADVAQPDAATPIGPKVREPKPVTPRPANVQLARQEDVAFGTADATVIDTRNFKRQIYRDKPFRGRQMVSSVFRPVKEGKPKLEPGPRNGLIPGTIAGQELAQPKAFFPGISASPWTPPDPALAVGPKYIVQTVNMEIAFFRKDDGGLEFQQRLDSSGNPGFFEEVGGGSFCFDPKCYYDHYSGRFLVLALEVYSGNGEAWITVAISDDDNPHGVWHKYRTWAVVDTGDTTYWVDYPGLGFDVNGMYVTGNLFKLDGPGGGFGGVLFRSFDKVPLLSGSTAMFTDIRDASGASVQVAQCFGMNTAPVFCSVENGSQLLVQSITDPFTNPVLVSQTVSVPSFSGPPQAPNSGGDLSVVGSRIMNAHWRDGSLWTCHTVTPPGDSNGLARWYEIDMGTWPAGPAPVLVQSGEIELGPDNHTFFPAVYTNNLGNAALVIGESTASTSPSIQGTGRLTGDAAGTMRPPIEFNRDQGADGRWGDYFDIAIDPTDDRTFWMVGEIQTSSGWQTWIESFTLEKNSSAFKYDVEIGQLIDGNHINLLVSDDFRMEVRSTNGSVVSTQFRSTTECATPARIWFSVESFVDSADSFDQMVEMYNYDAGGWELVDTRPATLNADSLIVVEPTGDLSRFVRAANNEITARVTMIRTSGSATPFDATFDWIQWAVAE